MLSFLRREPRAELRGVCVRGWVQSGWWFVVQDNGSAVPHHGFGVFRPESGTFLSQSALLGAQSMVCRQRQNQCGLRSSGKRPAIAFGGPQRKVDLRRFDLNPARTEKKHKEFMAAEYGARSAHNIGHILALGPLESLRARS